MTGMAKRRTSTALAQVTALAQMKRQPQAMRSSARASVM